MIRIHTIDIDIKRVKLLQAIKSLDIDMMMITEGIKLSQQKSGNLLPWIERPVPWLEEWPAESEVWSFPPLKYICNV